MKAIELSKKSKNTIQRLKNKRANSSNRMPSLSLISELLNELGVKHSLDGSVNIVEYRSRGNTYVNSRHEGKEGRQLSIHYKDNPIGNNLNMDSSDSYYSWNTYGYSDELLKIVEKLS